MIPPALEAFSSSALPVLDIAGTIVFAISGAIEAARARLTIVTFMFFAAITGVGGGTVRDLLIGAPVFWMHASVPIAACLLSAIAVWFTPARFWPALAVEWFDGLGIAAYGVFGSAKALAYGIPLIPAALMGIVSACMGGIFRDVLAGVPSIIIRPELYVTAVALASGSYVSLTALGLNTSFAAAIAVVAGFSLRAVALIKGLGLPHYKR
ncbi:MULTISPECIES: trimeric intracellular cation channel family protein [Gluconobacter]|uniref:Trimeric intracellular cation channel family protein n=1 Tax=Gluconobacter cadivus TaxID=2728101 RepID=A0ABR9YXA7_9PROT|nr:MULTISPECIES: trimeric intracellular cation channel family protein [Gluconobacter]MBF0889183.1 trimeric intracellular cation channel family protein [Gluconobacter cadivus]MBS1061063.1 trimeric intracellular cation channel family protein [Gluconobacter sp. Dm-44]